MEEYSLIWKGRLWRVTPDPICETDREKWLYAQAFVSASASVAIRAVLKERYPGIGWSGFTRNLVSFGNAASSVCDTSSHDGSSRNYSQSLKPLSSGRGAKDVASNTVDRNKRSPPYTTSSGGHSSVRAKVAAAPSRPPTSLATLCKVGWMGSGSTTV